MTPNDFVIILLDKTWKSSGRSTLGNDTYNKYPDGSWQKDLVDSNVAYYPPAGTQITIVNVEIVTKDAYKVPHNGDIIDVPKKSFTTFRMKVESSTNFSGKAALNGARFTVMGDHAISTPLAISSTKSVVLDVRLLQLANGKYIMVNELIWCAQYEPEASDSAEFYDIQKWYCCGYP